MSTTGAGDPDQDRRAAEALSLAPESLRAAGLAAAPFRTLTSGFKTAAGEYRPYWAPAAAAWRNPAIRLHSSCRLVALIVDIDGQDGDQRVRAAVAAGHILPPTCIVRDHRSGHWQAFWILSIPVHTQPWGVKDAPDDPAVRRAPLDYFRAVQRAYTAILDGCRQFDPCGLSRNPGYAGPGQSTEWMAGRAYSLDELNAPIPATLPERPAAGRKVGSRNPPAYAAYRRWCERNPDSTVEDRRAYLGAAADRRGESMTAESIDRMARNPPVFGPVDRAESERQARLGRLSGIKRAERLEGRRAEVHKLHREGWTQRAIAEHVGISRATVHDDLRAVLPAETAGPVAAGVPDTRARGIGETGPTAGPVAAGVPDTRARGIGETGPTAGPVAAGVPSYWDRNPFPVLGVGVGDSRDGNQTHRENATHGRGEGGPGGGPPAKTDSTDPPVDTSPAPESDPPAKRPPKIAMINTATGQPIPEGSMHWQTVTAQIRQMAGHGIPRAKIAAVCRVELDYVHELLGPESESDPADDPGPEPQPRAAGPAPESDPPANPAPDSNPAPEPRRGRADPRVQGESLVISHAERADALRKLAFFNRPPDGES